LKRRHYRKKFGVAQELSWEIPTSTLISFPRIESYLQKKVNGFLKNSYYTDIFPIYLGAKDALDESIAGARIQRSHARILG
jgi:hypothetical protein